MHCQLDCDSNALQISEDLCDYFVLQKLSVFYAICIFFFQKSPYPESFSSHSDCDNRQMEVQHITINACTLYNRL